MKKILIPLMTVAVVVALLIGGCMPEAPVTPPPVTPPPVTPPPVTPPPVAPPEVPPENPYAGLGIKPDGTQYYFPHVQCFTGNDWVKVCIGIHEAMCEMAGARHTMHDPKMDVMTQIGMLEDLIGRNPDALLVHAVDGPTLGPVIDKYAEAGIPVFQLNLVHIPSEGIVAYSGFESYEMGTEAGRYAADEARRLGKHLNVYIIYGMLEMGDIAIRRGEGFKDVAKALPHLLTAIEGPDCGWVHAPATDAIIAYLPAHPECNAIYEMGSMNKGVIEGLRSIGMLYPVGHPDHIVMVSHDEEMGVVEAIEAGWTDAVVHHSPYKLTAQGMDLLFTSVCLGKPVPYSNVCPTTIRTYEDVGTPLWECTWGKLMLEGVPYDEWPIPHPYPPYAPFQFVRE